MGDYILAVKQGNTYRTLSVHPSFESAFESWLPKVQSGEYTSLLEIQKDKQTVFNGYADSSAVLVLDVREAKRVAYSKLRQYR